MNPEAIYMPSVAVNRTGRVEDLRSVSEEIYCYNIAEEKTLKGQDVLITPDHHSTPEQRLRNQSAAAQRWYYFHVVEEFSVLLNNERMMPKLGFCVDEEELT